MILALASVKVMLQIVASLIDAARGIIYNRHMFIVQATGLTFFLVRALSIKLYLCGVYMISNFVLGGHITPPYSSFCLRPGVNFTNIL
jgi:hypothetical protein